MVKSLLDPEGKSTITEELWVVAILRNKIEKDEVEDKSSFLDPSEHAFVVVEGMLGNGRLCYRRYDLFIDRNDPGRFIIRMKEKSVYPDQDIAFKTLTNEFLQGKEVVGKCWEIDAHDAAEIRINIERINKNPGEIYNILGDDALLPKTIASAGSGASMVSSVDSISGAQAAKKAKGIINPGHNCFTWARALLYSLGIPEIRQDLPKKTSDLIVAIPSKHLKESHATACETITETGSKCLIL